MTYITDDMMPHRDANTAELRKLVKAAKDRPQAPYATRDTQELGKVYTDHVDGLTKATIGGLRVMSAASLIRFAAAELAHRDMQLLEMATVAQIELTRLQVELGVARAANTNYRSENTALKAALAAKATPIM
jgi:hypothetical protein